MSEVEKMYENANIKPEKIGYCDWDCDCPYPDIIENDNCGDECPYWKYEDEATYPPFTAEKQIELIKWLCQKTYRNYIHIRYERDINNWKIECNMVGIREFGSFDECFAGLINNLWQDLTEQEKTQIRSILNG